MIKTKLLLKYSFAIKRKYLFPNTAENYMRMIARNSKDYQELIGCDLREYKQLYRYTETWKYRLNKWKITYNRIKIAEKIHNSYIL
jgi:hypothetical protein